MGLLGIALNLQPIAVRAQGALHEFREAHMGLEVRVAIVHEHADSAAALARRAFDVIEREEALLSDWRERGEVRSLERAAPGEWTPISRSLAEVLALALRVARATDGAFDPTVGPLTALWREARRTGQGIDDSARTAARGRVGYRLVELDSSSARVRFAVAGMRLDLGAVAKGWILDRALDVLAEAGVRDALVEAGGDLVVRGAPPGATGWRVGVPRARGDTVIELNAGAVSTSGPGTQHLRSASGRGESHVLDARSGWGGQQAGGVTVIGRRGALTDALATALSLVPIANRARVAAEFDVRVLAP